MSKMIKWRFKFLMKVLTKVTELWIQMQLLGILCKLSQDDSSKSCGRCVTLIDGTSSSHASFCACLSRTLTGESLMRFCENLYEWWVNYIDCVCQFTSAITAQRCLAVHCHDYSPPSSRLHGAPKLNCHVKNTPRLFVTSTSAGSFSTFFTWQ